MDILIVVVITIVLLFLSAAFSGLNIGLMMARPDELARKADQGDEVAKKVYGYRKNGNFLIVCVLLSNVAVISILSLVLESVAGGIIAGVTTTLLVTAFGEILPQSLFSRKGYRLTRHFFWLLDIIFVLLWPIAKPVSILLDKYIGHELPAMYSHDEFKHMIQDHAEHESSAIDHDESRIIAGALQFSATLVEQIMTPIAAVMTIELDDEVDAAMVSRIKREGHSRMPVVDIEGRYVGILYSKDILGRTLPNPVSHVYRDKINDVGKSTPLDTVLSRFIQTKSHLFLVVDDMDKAIGIVTLEDVMEEILSREIEDEFDGES